MMHSRSLFLASMICSGLAAVAPSHGARAQTSRGFVLAQVDPANRADAKPTTNETILRTVLRTRAHELLRDALSAADE
jgi:hypothetical protein